MKNYSKLLVSVLMLVSVFVIPIYASEGGKTEMSQMESNSSLSILEDICAQKELYRVLDYEGQDISQTHYMELLPNLVQKMNLQHSIWKKIL